jgi:hypothetical protein
MASDFMPAALAAKDGNEHANATRDAGAKQPLSMRRLYSPTSDNWPAIVEFWDDRQSSNGADSYAATPRSSLARQAKISCTVCRLLQMRFAAASSEKGGAQGNMAIPIENWQDRRSTARKSGRHAMKEGTLDIGSYECREGNRLVLGGAGTAGISETGATWDDPQDGERDACPLSSILATKYRERSEQRTPALTRIIHERFYGNANLRARDARQKQVVERAQSKEYLFPPALCF